MENIKLTVNDDEYLLIRIALDFLHETGWEKSAEELKTKLCEQRTEQYWERRTQEVETS